jgi:leucyl aminopeptidase
VPPEGVDAAELTRMAEAAFLARDLINTPSNDMGPAEMETAARDVASALARSSAASRVKT